jgi:hypothetical protein
LIVASGCYRVTDRGEKRSQVIEVVDHEEGGAQHLLGGEQVVEVTPGVTAAGVTAAGADQRCEVVFEGFVFQVHGVGGGMGRDVSGLGRRVSDLVRVVSDGAALNHRRRFGYLKNKMIK